MTSFGPQIHGKSSLCSLLFICFWITPSVEVICESSLEYLVLRLGGHVVDHDVGGAHVLEERVLVEEARAVPDGHGARLTPEPGHKDILWDDLTFSFKLLILY